MTDTELAYLAGIIDGEGSITARSYWAPKSINPSEMVYERNRLVAEMVTLNHRGVPQGALN
jgi:hypothetical protein